MAKKRKKTIKIEITVPEFFYRLRKPQATDVEKIKASLPRNEKMTRFVRENNKLVCVAVVVIAAIIVVSFMFLANYQLPAEPEEGYVPQKVNRTKTVTVTVPVNMSFEEYLENSVNYEDEIVTVTGFLKNDIMWAKGAGSRYSVLFAWFSFDHTCSTPSVSRPSTRVLAIAVVMSSPAVRARRPSVLNLPSIARLASSFDPINCIALSCIVGR